MADPVFIIKSPSGKNLLSFQSLADAKAHRDRVSTDRAQFQIVRQIITEERVA